MENKNEEDPLWWAERISELGIVAGGGAALEHRLVHGRWYDEDKPVCHGEIGIAVFAVSLLVRIGCAVVRATRPKCPHCSKTLAYISGERRYYCETCQAYFLDDQLKRE
jgi:hypothetical protein